MNSSNSLAAPVSIDAPRLLVATGAIAVTGAMGDFLFWRSAPGLSVGLFFLVLGSGLYAIGRRSVLGATALALLLGSAVQSGIELSFTNVVALATLLLLVFGESSYPGIPGLWARWSEAAFAAMRGPFRWSALLRDWAHTRLAAASSHHLQAPTLVRLAVTVIPGAAVAVIFVILLSAGNAILAEALSRIVNLVERWLLDISIARSALWVCWLTVGVSFFWPCPAEDKPRWWTRSLPLWTRSEPKLALWQSIILLGAVNVVFFAANTADAIYLWWHNELPAGVTYSGFVHQGVYALISAVVLAAGFLALVFQQQPSIARSQILRGLALAWVLQNMVLIGGVLRRLQLYVDSYGLSELRVYVGCFLLLVAIGFLLLAIHIHRGMNLGRLIGSNLIATLALFYTLQFLDVGTWVAQWNVAQWKADPRRTLDMAYLTSLGSRGWPAIEELARDDRPSIFKEEADRLLRAAAIREASAMTQADWRGYQHRRDSRVRWIVKSYLERP